MKPGTSTYAMFSIIAVVGALAFPINARADQGGVAFWWSGQFASLAAVPSAPGWSLITSPYYYNGSARQVEDLSERRNGGGGLKSTVPLLMFQPGYAPEEKILGDQPYVGVGCGTMKR